MSRVADIGLQTIMIYLPSVGRAHDCPFDARLKDPERTVQFDNHGGFDDVGLRT
jgi:hypothetical protein